MNKLKNEVPKKYRAYYMEPGLADYTAEGVGVVLVGREALDKMAASFIGKPVVNEAHTELEPEDLFNLENEAVQDFADGVVSEVGFDNDKGWHWADMLIWNKETQENIDEFGYSVSCAYDVTETGEGGSYHNVQYDEEVLNGDYLHMAVVSNPRYEKAFVIQNSKNPEEDTLKIVFSKKKKEAPVKKKKVQNAEPDEKDEEVELENGYVENEAGEQVPIEELANMYKEKMAKKNMGKKYNADDKVTVDGKEMTVGELMSAIEEDEEVVENAEPAQTEDIEEVVDEGKQMNNSKVKNENFEKVKNAAGKDEKVFKPKNLNTVSERLTRGKARYGTAVAQGGK